MTQPELFLNLITANGTVKPNNGSYKTIEKLACHLKSESD